MRIVALSDLHGNLPELPESDICIVCGDICPVNNHNIFFQADWINDTFRRWVHGIKTKRFIYIAGNHDFVFQDKKHLIEFDRIKGKYLEDSGVEVEGLKIWGSPWQPVFFDWSFNLTEPELEKKWALIPLDTQVLITHGPPFGYGDLTDRGERVGSWTLANRLKELDKLKLHVYGHIHSGRGQWHVGSSISANATLLDEKYRLVYPPMSFDIPVDKEG